MFSFDSNDRAVPLRIAEALVWVQAALVGVVGLVWLVAGILFDDDGSISVGPITAQGGTAAAIGVLMIVIAVAFGYVAVALRHPTPHVRMMLILAECIQVVFAFVAGSGDVAGIAIHLLPVAGIAWCLTNPEMRTAFSGAPAVAAAATTATTASTATPATAPEPAATTDAPSAPADTDDTPASDSGNADSD